MIGLGRLYTVQFNAVSISATQDLFSILPASNIPCVLEAFYFSNVAGTSDAGDAQEELLSLLIQRRAAISQGSGGSTPSKTPVEQNDSAASFTVHANDTTQATGTASVIHADGINIRIPYVWMPPPEHRIVVANSAGLCVTLNTAPADAVSCSGTIYVRELP